jgi:quinone-modifying oxidoreductase subunit QmoC
MPDSSLTLSPAHQRSTAELLSIYCADSSALTACLQCGACSVNCNLAGEDLQFPRRQMALVHVGQADELVADPSIWLCYNCRDCTLKCPSKAGPSRIMAAARQLAVGRYCGSSSICRRINEPLGFAAVLAASLAVVLAAVLISGAFSPQSHSVVFSKMLPHAAVYVLFGTVFLGGTFANLRGMARAWRAYTQESAWRARPDLLLSALHSVSGQIACHSRFRQCEQVSVSRMTHIGLFVGFATLVALTCAAAVLSAVHATYPLPALNPLKIAGNAGAAMVIGGSILFLLQRVARSWSGDPSTWFDWALPIQLLLVCATGVLAEVFRYDDNARFAYPTYVAHLTFVLAFFATAPASKIAHMIYRTTALTANRYKDLCLERLTHRPYRRAVA